MNPHATAKHKTVVGIAEHLNFVGARAEWPIISLQNYSANSGHQTNLYLLVNTNINLSLLGDQLNYIPVSAKFWDESRIIDVKYVMEYVMVVAYFDTSRLPRSNADSDLPLLEGYV
jgi:hypothetical protein